MTDSTTLTAQIVAVGNNPAAIQQIMLQELEALSTGTIRIVDVSNPVSFTLESAAIMAAACMSQAEALNRQQYPSLAQTQDELYLHMSDEDFVNVFASPSNTTIKLMFSLDEIIQKAVPVYSGGPSSIPTGVSLLTLPRQTQFLVADVPFTMQYPVDIQVNANQSIQVTYDISKPSPLQVLNTNQVQWYITTIGGLQYLYMELAVLQMAINTQNVATNSATGFSKTFAFTDQYYYTRAYLLNSSGLWTEIKTTYTDLVYDPTVPTVALTVANGQLTATIPQIYFATNQISDSIRLDIYTTKGNINLLLANYDPSAFSAIWTDADSIQYTGGAVSNTIGSDSTNANFSAPLATLQVIAIYGDAPVTDGTDGFTFTELRTQVMNNSLGPQVIPITNVQLASKLDSMGYTLTLDTDSVTDRTYLASKPLPVSTVPGSTTPANCAMIPFVTSISALTGLDTTYWNGSDRLTILPNTIYQLINGQVSIVPNTVVQYLNSLNNTSLVAQLNATQYLYTPFHYVLDVTTPVFALRPYYMGAPAVLTEFFEEQNTNVGMSVTVGGYSIAPDGLGTGYYLDITTQSDANFRNQFVGLTPSQYPIQLQLSYQPPDFSIGNYATMTGTDITPIIASGGTGTERIYRFHITTTFDVDASDNMQLTSFSTTGTNAENTIANLITTFNLVFVLTGVSFATTAIDSLIDANMLPGIINYIGIDYEQITIQFGTYLQWLWQAARSVSQTLPYAKYPNDILAYYTQDIYQRSPAGNIVITVDGSGNLVSTKIHSQGDPVLINNGTTVTDTLAAAIAQSVLTFSTATFTSTDLGKAFILAGAGPGGNGLVGTISEVNSPTVITLSVPLATATIGGEAFSYGTQALLHAAGDTILDSNGNPTYVGGTAQTVMQQQCSMFFVDGRYAFATDSTTLNYAASIPTFVTDWVSVDMVNMAALLLDRTEMYYFPTTSLGLIPVITGNDINTTINAEQSLTVTYYLTEANYLNPDVLAALTTAAQTVCPAQLAIDTIAMSTMQATLAATVGTDVLGLSITGLGGVLNLAALTVVDGSITPSIGKQAVVLADQTIAVTDSLNIVFVNHLPS